MELHDAAAAQRLHSLRVGEALATGQAPDPRRLPDRPSRGVVLGLVLAVVVLLLVGVVGVMVGAFQDGDPMSAPAVPPGVSVISPSAPAAPGSGA